MKIKIRQISPDPTLKWHQWFAWYPIYFKIYSKNGPVLKMRVWRKHIWRQKQWFRGVWGDEWFYHYSFKKEKPDDSERRYFGVLGDAYAEEAGLALEWQ